MTQNAQSLQATVVITTKNRKADLVAAIESALNQTARPEVLVIDDGSTDGTSEMVHESFPQARLHRVEQSQGYIVQRNHAAHLASGAVIFSIDDDAIFSTPNVIQQTLTEFDHPRVGAVAIPFINVRQSPHVHQRADDSDSIWVTSSYIGTAHAVRRELFLKLGGYREFLFHQGEEGDLSIRMLDGGYVVRLGRADPIHHFESPRRDSRRMDLYGRRNDILYAWYNVPMPFFPAHLLGTTVRGLTFGFRHGRPWPMTVGLSMGYSAIFHEFRRRHPVRRQAYRLSRLLQRKQRAVLDEIESMLPKAAGGSGVLTGTAS